MRGKNETKNRRARRLRQVPTTPEMLLWARLRNRQLDGFKFVRQEPIGPYCVDFLCRDRRLVVEVDGVTHVDAPTDAQRDEALAALGYRTIRVWNNELMSNVEGVLEMLLTELRK